MSPGLAAMISIIAEALPIIGSAEALPILCVRYFWWERERERERERDGSDVTIVALKLAMSLHFPLPKIRTFRFSLHTSRLSLHGEVTMVVLKFAMGSHFPLPKIVSPSGFVPPSFKWHEPRDEWSKTQDKMIKSCPVLFCSSHRKTESN